MKSVGTFTLLNAERESQVSANCNRWESTRGFTDLIAAFTAPTRAVEASRPTSRRRIKLAGGRNKKQTGDRSRQMRLIEPRTGLVANPAQITRGCHQTRYM